MRTGLGALVLVAAAAVAGCSDAADRPAPASAPPSSWPPSSWPPSSSQPVPVPPVASACPADPVLERSAPPRRQSVGAPATALFFDGAVTAGVEVKIVWTMPGTGDFAIRATGPGNTTARPAWGPETHLEANEWGTGWVFPSAGCWTFVATRAQATARLTVRVGPASR